MTTSLSEWDDEAEELGHWTSALVDGIRTPIWVPHCSIHVECEQPCRVCAAPLGPAEGEE